VFSGFGRDTGSLLELLGDSGIGGFVVLLHVFLEFVLEVVWDFALGGEIVLLTEFSIDEFGRHDLRLVFPGDGLAGTGGLLDLLLLLLIVNSFALFDFLSVEQLAEESVESVRAIEQSLDDLGVDLGSGLLGEELLDCLSGVDLVLVSVRQTAIGDVVGDIFSVSEFAHQCHERILGTQGGFRDVSVSDETRVALLGSLNHFTVPSFGSVGGFDVLLSPHLEGA